MKMNQNKSVKYIFSFTGATALIAETLVIAEEYERLKDWSLVESYLVETNLLNKIKQATFKREFNEIRKRLYQLTPIQREILIKSDLDDTKAIIFLSLVKTYSFFKDFVVEVIRNKYWMFDKTISETDYDIFFNTKALMHSELNQISDSTAKKVKQRTFTLLEQTGLITQVKNGIIIRPFLSNQISDAIVEDDPSLLSAFLYSNEEIKRMKQKLKHV